MTSKTTRTVYRVEWRPPGKNYKMKPFDWAHFVTFRSKSAKEDAMWMADHHVPERRILKITTTVKTELLYESK